jgi:hypothetical protein
MIAQISRTAPTTPDDRGSGRITPKFIYPDSEDRSRVIVFNITGHTQTEVFKVDLSIQQRHGGRWFLGQLQRQADGWAIAYIQRTTFDDGVIYESVEAAAIACHDLYRAAKRAARVTNLKD